MQFPNSKIHSFSYIQTCYKVGGRTLLRKRNTIRAVLLLHSNKDLQQADFILENGVREENLYMKPKLIFILKKVGGGMMHWINYYL